MLVQASLCGTCSESTLLVFPQGGSFVFLQQAEYERMTKDVNRSAYTKRIMEIVANIKKQKKEIDKVVQVSFGRRVGLAGQIKPKKSYLRSHH